MVGLGISGFEEENPPSDLSKSVFGGGDPFPTVTSIRSAGFRVGPGGLGGWVGFWVPVDTPNLYNRGGVSSKAPIALPPKFKISDAEKFDGIGDPK